MALDDAALATLFADAHTYTRWQDRPIDDALLHKLYDTLKWAPTGANSQAGRFVFVKSPEAKERLKPALDEGNVRKAMTAGATVIVAADFEFYEHLNRLYPVASDPRSWFAGNPAAIEFAATRDATLQGAYLILAARALGLDCGPMGGFNRAKVDAEFFAGTQYKSIFLVNLGYGAPDGHYPRNPRFDFDEACKIA